MINGGQTSSEGTLQTNDLDGDGDEEIISSKDPISNENMVLLYQNADGEGSFLPRQRLDSGGFLMNLETKIDDLDSDGMNDVIANGHTKLSWFENLTELPTIDLYGQDLTGTKVGLNQLEVNMDVLNGGNTPAGEFAVAFFVVRRDEENLAGAEVDKIGKKIGVVVIPSLEAGETHHISQTFRVRDLDLYKILGAIIDPANQISETDETNNRLRARMVGTGSQIYR